LAFTTLAWLFPPRERSRWAGLIGAVFGLAAALGPPLGGFLTEKLGWRWTFWINLPLGAMGILLIARFMPKLPPLSQGQFDWKGTILLAAWVFAWVMGVSAFGPQAFISPVIGIALLLLGAGGFLLWLRIERRTASPLFDLSYGKVRTFRYAALASFFFGPAFFGGCNFFASLPAGGFGTKPFSKWNVSFSADGGECGGDGGGRSVGEPPWTI
jgi:MFS family permease